MERKASQFSAAVGAVIRGRYRKVPMNQETLATATGISITTLQRAIAGKAEFDMDQITEIAAVLNTTVTSLISEAETDIAEQMSAASNTTNDLDTKRKQNEARAMTVEQIEAQKHAATRDPELETDEPTDT